jgi:hypothetical protein
LLYNSTFDIGGICHLKNYNIKDYHVSPVDQIETPSVLIYFIFDFFYLTIGVPKHPNPPYIFA